MKKKKAPGQPSADFKNSPFRSLKGLTPHQPSAQIARIPPQRKIAQSEDDEELFLRAVSGARRIGGEEDPSMSPVPEKPGEPPHTATREDHELFLRAVQKIGTTLRDRKSAEEEPDETRRKAPSSRARQLKRGSIRISDELDLHGCLRDEALGKLERFIKSAHARGQEAVLIITGKGVNSPEGPVLQGAAAEWLRERGKGMVAEFSPAPRNKGGSGAFVVFLKKK